MSQGLAAFAVHAVTTPAARGRGVFSTLELHNEQEAAAAGATWALGFTNPMAGPILVGKLGWEDVTSLRIWVRPKRLRRRGRGRAARRSRASSRSPSAMRRRIDGHHIVRDAGVSELALRATRRGRTCARGRRRLGGRHARRLARLLVGGDLRGRRRRARCCARCARGRRRPRRRDGQSRARSARISRPASCRRRARSASSASGSPTTRPSCRSGATPGISRSATSTSSDAQARLRDAEARPRRSGARRDRADGARARGAGRRARRALRHRGAGRRAGERARARVRRADAGCSAARGSTRALARELRPRPIGVVAHMVPLYAVLAAPLVRPLAHPARALVHALEGPRGRARGREASARRSSSVDARSFPLASQKVHAIGHGIDVAEFACADAPRRRAAARARARPLLAGEGARDDPARGAALAGVARRGARLRRDVRGRTSASSSGSRASSASTPSSAARCRAREVPALFARSHVLVNNMRAGAPDKVVYEAAASCLPVLASNPVFDDLLPPELRFEPRRRRRASRSGSRTLDRAAPAGAARGSSRATTRSSTGPTALLATVERAMKRDTILHLQKVAGISGSEAHLLSLLPRAARARLGRPDADAARERAGRVGLRARARGARRAARRDPAARRRRPDRVRAARRVPRARTARRSCTRISCTPTRTACSPARSRACRCASRRSTASTSSARRRTSASPTARSRASRTCTSRSRAGSRATSRTSRASTARASRSSTTGSTRTASRSRTPTRVPRLLCVGRLIPIKGHIVLLRAFAEARRAAARPRARDRRPRPARAGAEGARARARHRRRGPLPRPRLADPGGDRARGGRRRAVDGRGLRHGRARGDGARAAGDRRGDRRPRRARARRRDRPARARRARPSRCATRSSALAGDLELARRDGRGRPPARALALPPDLLHRADRAALRGRARASVRVERDACRSAMRATENSRCARSRPASPRPRLARARCAIAAASAAGSSAGTSMPVSPSTTSSGSELTRVATTGSAGEHRLEHAEAEALPARRVDEHASRGEATPRRPARGRAGRRAARRRARARAPRAARAPGLRRARRARCRPAASGSARIATSMPFCARQPRRSTSRTRASAGTSSGGFSPHASGSVVEAVVDRLDLRRRHADLLDREVAQRVGDRDDPVGHAQRAAARRGGTARSERIVVVLRRDELRAAQLRGDAAVDVGVHEVRVHDVGAQRARRAARAAAGRGRAASAMRSAGTVSAA